MIFRDISSGLQLKSFLNRFLLNNDNNILLPLLSLEFKLIVLETKYLIT